MLYNQHAVTVDSRLMWTGTAPLGTTRQITLISAEDLFLPHLILPPKDQVVLSFLAFCNPKLISVGLFELQGTAQHERGWLYSGPWCAIDLFLKPIKTDIFLYIFSSRTIMQIVITLHTICCSFISVIMATNRNFPNDGMRQCSWLPQAAIPHKG